ncbi:MAG: hypothetical protein KatS3mg123_1761 [Burkholderiales bacterium]|nr:MAG: hypothetical protein KatS3mg123_1761 [Burkholderiales bacterium]
MAFIRHFCDARTGQVAVIWKPVSMRAVSIVSQPVVRSTRSPFPLPLALLLVGAALHVVLLEGVVDGQGKARVHLLPQDRERPAEALLEVLLGLALVAIEPLGGGHQLRLLGHQDRAEELGVEVADGAPQPHVEEVREGRVADVVVVGRVGGDEDVLQAIPGARGVDGAGLADRHTANPDGFQPLSFSLHADQPRPDRLAKRVAFAKVPDHGDRLSREQVDYPDWGPHLHSELL